MRLVPPPLASGEGYSSANKLKPNLTIYMTQTTDQGSCQHLAAESVDAVAMLMWHSPALASSGHQGSLVLSEPSSSLSMQ